MDEYLIDMGSAALMVMVSDHRALNITEKTAIAGMVKALQAGAASNFNTMPVTIDGHTGVLAAWQTAEHDQMADRIFFVGGRTDSMRVRGENVSAWEIERVFAPCGLDIGASTVEETAVSVLAEIIAHRAGRQGQPLREAAGPIRHADTTEDQEKAEAAWPIPSP